MRTTSVCLLSINRMELSTERSTKNRLRTKRVCKSSVSGLLVTTFISWYELPWFMSYVTVLVNGVHWITTTIIMFNYLFVPNCFTPTIFLHGELLGQSKESYGAVNTRGRKFSVKLTASRDGPVKSTETRQGWKHILLIFKNYLLKYSAENVITIRPSCYR